MKLFIILNTHRKIYKFTISYCSIHTQDLHSFPDWILMLTQIRILKYDITWSEVIFQFTSCDTSNSEINYAFIICWYVHVLTYFHWMKHCMWHTITMKLISYLQCIQCTTHPVVAVKVYSYLWQLIYVEKSEHWVYKCTNENTLFT